MNKFKSNENVIIGNTVLYGATGGMLFASGKAGERFAVRNSGSKAVVEGCGSNGCEYMTGGVTVILGKVGDNFGAGMTGGMSFVYDPNNEFENYANPQTIVWQKPETEYWKKELQSLLTQFVNETDSKIAKDILDNFEDEVLKFKQICPKEMLDKLEKSNFFKRFKIENCLMTNNYFFGFGQVAKYYVDELIKRKKNLIFLLQQHLTRQLRDLKVKLTDHLSLMVINMIKKSPII